MTDCQKIESCIIYISVRREHAMVSVGFCVISTVKRAYPVEDATHIALSNLFIFYLNFLHASCV